MTVVMGAISKCHLDTLYEEEALDLKKGNRDDSVSYDRAKLEVEKHAYLKHKENFDLDQAQQDIQNAKEEWDLVTSTVPLTKSAPTITVPVTCEDVLHYFHSKNMAPFLKYIKPVKSRTRIEGLIRWLIGPPKLQQMLICDRDLLFSIAQCPFDSSDSIHLRILQTIYKRITGNKLDCPRYGSHWEDIGFQGVDPGTDLRGVGFLGLYHLLYFILNPQTTELCREVSSLARSDAQEFPFCVMGINITRIVLEAMREEVLNKECNRQQDVFQVTSNFYCGVYLHFYQLWKGQKKTIMDSGYVLKELSSFSKKNPSAILQALSSHCERKVESQQYRTAHCSFTDIGGISLKPCTATML